MIRGGYSCAMQECKNISGRIPGLSFFRFPKDPDRAKLWLTNCGRSIQVPIEQLYKNYRICANHFDSNMFLNDLKNRLQPHAFPKPMQNIIDDQSHRISVYDDQSHVTSVYEDQSHVISICDPLLLSNDQISIEHNYINRCEIKEENSKDHMQEILIQMPNITQDQSIQTDVTLSRDTPQKIKLKNKIRSLRRELKKVKQQLKQQESNVQNIADRFSPEEYCNVTDRFLPPPIAKFVKTQVHVANTSPKNRRYSTKFKSSRTLQRVLYNEYSS